MKECVFRLLKQTLSFYFSMKYRKSKKAGKFKSRFFIIPCFYSKKNPASCSDAGLV
jgi:competence CoiA-like predicted nuclease